MDKTATEVVLELVANGMEKEAAIGGAITKGISLAAKKLMPKLFKSKYTTFNPRMLKTGPIPRNLSQTRGGIGGMISNPKMPSGGVNVIGADGVPRRVINFNPPRPNLQTTATRGNPYGYIDADGDRVIQLLKQRHPQLDQVHKYTLSPKARAFMDRPGAMRGSDGRIY